MTEWRVYYDGALINDKISSFTITMSRTNFCKEITLDIADPSFFGQIDWTEIPSSPKLEVKIYENGVEHSLGQFFVERPTYVTDPRSQILRGIWGRSLTAKLGPPFAKKITKVWDTDTLLHSILQELVEEAGLTFYSETCHVENYYIYGNSIQVTQQYPINILKNLMTLCGGYITTDLQDRVVFKPQEFELNDPNGSFDDSVISSLTERVVFPDFGNRIKVASTGSISGYGINLSIPEPCLPADGSTSTKLYARVVDKDGNPIDDVVVNWTLDSTDHATLSHSATNTGTLVITDELQQAANSFTKVRTEFPPSEVIGIYSYKDMQHTHNYAAAGVTISSNLIQLTGDQFKYCDQHLKITYVVKGVATNTITSTYTPGNVEVSASIEGAVAKGQVYVQNPCACPPTLQMFINPYTIKVNGIASVLLYAEENGTCVQGGRRVYLSENTNPKRGELSWEFARLGTVNVTNEKTTAINEIEGVTQCLVKMFPSAVSGVWRADEDGNKVGSNLFDSFSGKVIDLNAHVDSGEDLLVDYTACGAALAYFTGRKVGTAKLVGFLPTLREEPLQATGTVSIVDEYTNDWATDDVPTDWEPSDDTDLGDEDYGGTGGDGGVDGGEFDEGEQDDQEPSSGMCPPTEDVSQEPSLDRLCGRFTAAIAPDGCDCQIACEEEFNKYQTTQGYDNASYKTIDELMAETYPDESPDDPATSSDYWAHYQEMQQDMINSCVEECQGQGQCSQCVITGPDAVTKPGTYQYAASGGQGPYTWSVSGTGVSIDQTGLVTLDNSACGSFTITLQDSVGCTTTKDVRVSNNGIWGNSVTLCHNHISPCASGNELQVCVVGKFQYEQDWSADIYFAGKLWPTSPARACESFCDPEYPFYPPFGVCTVEAPFNVIRREWMCL